MSWGRELKEKNLLTRLDWKFEEHVGGMVVFWTLFKFYWALYFGLMGYYLMKRSEFYEMIIEQDFNRDIQKSFHFVPFIACVHAFCISK